jgi:pyruvate kinase
VPVRESTLRLHKRDTLILTRQASGRPAKLDAQGRVVSPACVPCTLPDVLTQVHPGERIWFDDGRIGGVIRHVQRDEVHVEITVAREEGEKLAADKGINLPDSKLMVDALSPKDLEDLEFVVRHADMVGLSFVRRVRDVELLQGQLTRLGTGNLGIVLKIENRAAFEHLPDLLLAGMRSPELGVMIARGDLAVEMGWERLAEVQEEILWLTEAAHVPVIWATQVLETLAKRGVPSRAEITDAAMGERAECVMLNKGPHILDAIEALDDILGRMQAHQHKKRSMLRKLHWWQHLPARAPAQRGN